MNVLISGCNGFVGQNLVRSLKGSFGIHALAREKKETFASFKTITTWDELSPEHLQDVDAVIHLAGKAHDLKNTSNAAEYFHVNTDLTIKLFDLFLQSPVKDFIYFSSVKAAADTVVGRLKEDGLPDPKTPYGQSKRKAEEYLLAQALPEGKRMFILRPCMIHGPGNKGNLNLLYQFVRKGIPYPLAAFRNKRSFLSIDNLCFIVKRILEDASIPGGVYHVADDEPLSTVDVINIMGEARQEKARLWTLSPKLIQIVAAVGDKLRLPLNSERLQKLTESYVVDNSKIKAALQIDALSVSSRDGLFATIKSYQNQ